MKLPKLKISFNRAEKVKTAKALGISAGGLVLVKIVAQVVPALNPFLADPDVMAFAVAGACALIAAVKQFVVDHTPLG